MTAPLIFLLLLLTLITAQSSQFPDSAVAGADKISAALSAAGYHTMSTILRKNINLLQTAPYVTVFVPGDEALDGVGDGRVEVEHQMVPLKIDARFLKENYGSVVEVPSLSKKRKLLVTGQGLDGGYGYINNVKIVKWNMYDDGHVIVHGVQHLFPYRGDD